MGSQGQGYPRRTSAPVAATGARLLGAVLLAVSGVFMAMGGAVRWSACFAPGSWGPACRMHDDWYSYAPGIDEPLGLGYILLAPALLVVVLATRHWLAILATLLIVPGYALLGVSTLLPLGPAAKGQERLAWYEHLIQGGPYGLTEDTGVKAFLAEAWVSAALFGALAAVGIYILVQLAHGPERRLRRVVGWSVVTVALANSVVGWTVLNMFSGSHDDPTGMYVVQGLVAVLAAGALVLALGHGRALAGAAGGGLLLLGGLWWAMAGSIRWRYCWEAGPWACTATGGEGIVELPAYDVFRPLEPDTVLVLWCGILLVVAGLALVVLVPGPRGAALRLVGAVVWLAVGAAIAVVNRGDDAPLVMAEVAYGIVTVGIGLLMLRQLTRRLSPAEGDAARSAGSPRRDTPAQAGPAPAAR